MVGGAVVGDAAVWVKVAGLFPCETEGKVLRVSEHLHWCYIYIRIPLLSQLGINEKKVGWAPLIKRLL